MQRSHRRRRGTGPVALSDTRSVRASLRSGSWARYRDNVTTPRLDIRILGPVDIRVDGRPLQVDTRKAVALLAYLSVVGRPTSRTTLAALLWPDADDEGARGALRRTLSVLNTALGPAVLRIGRSEVALELDVARVDVVVFRAAMARVRAHSHDRRDGVCPSCQRTLSDALRLDRGELMDGFSLRDSESWDDWHRGEAEVHRRDLAAALERVAAARLVDGAWDRALEAGRRWLQLDPLHEPAHRLLMEIHARAGEGAAAIGQYRECVSVLDRELGVAPLPETIALYEAIRDGRYGAASPGEPHPAAATPSLRAPSGVQPVPVPADRELPLVGREREVAAVLEAYGAATNGGRIVALVGEAGIGKTRVGVQATEQLTGGGAPVIRAAAYPGEESVAYGLVLTLLRAGFATSDGAAARLPAHVAAEIGRLAPSLVARADGAPGVEAALAGHVGLLDAIALTVDTLLAGEQPGVLWIDTLESADASSLEALAYLVRRLAGRRLLLVLAWRPEDVGPRVAPFIDLVESYPRTTLIRLDRLDAAAVTSLVEAARTGDGEAVDAATLATESEGLPLYVAEVLRDRTGHADGRHAGLRGLVRERMAALGAVERQVLATAAVIGRSFALDTVRQASGRSDDEAVEAIDGLVRRGLIRELVPSPDLRYDFRHGAFRDTAYEDTSLARRRLLHARVAEAIRLVPASTPAARLERLTLVAAHEAAAGRESAAAQLHVEAAEMARALSAPRDAIAHLEAARAFGHPDAAAIHLALGEVHVELGDYAAGLQALEVAAAMAGPQLLPEVELQLGRAHARRGDFRVAAAHLVAASAPAGWARDDTLAVRVGIERGLVAYRANDLGAAEAHATEARGSAADTAGPALTAADRLVGLVSLARGDLDRARMALDASLTRAVQDGDTGAAIAGRNGLALVEAAAGRHAEAVTLLETALEDCRRSGSRHLEAALENNLADALHALGRDDESRRHQTRAVSLFAEVGRSDQLAPEIWMLTAW